MTATPDRIDSIVAERPPRDGDEWDCQCARCGSSVDWTRCDQCEDGYSYHSCGEDCCNCLVPVPNVTCDTCHGYSGWHTCLSSPDWCEANPLTGRETVARGQLEWFRDGRHEPQGEIH